MKKKLLSGLLCICVMLSMMPIGISATEQTTNEHDGEEFTIITEMPTENGRYCLGNDIVLEETWEILSSKKIEICLHGHSIIADGDFDAIFIRYNTGTQSLTLRDYEGGGTITHTSGKLGRALVNYGRCDIYDISITGNHIVGTDEAEEFGGAAIHSHAWINMYSGEITGNTVTGEGGQLYGGGIFNDRGSVYIYGGTISGNSVINSKENGNAYGGGIGNIYGKIIMEGGLISENSVKTVNGGIAYGGGFAFNGASNSRLELSGGTITNNKSSYGGGGVFFGGNEFTMTGGEISENEALVGGGVQVIRKFNMSAGVIKDNLVKDSENGSVSGRGGGVIAEGGYAEVTVSGTAVIDGNKKITADDAGTSYNLVMSASSSRTPYIAIGTMEDGANIGVTAINLSNLDNNIILSTETTEEDAAYFVADDPKTEVFFDEADNRLKLKRAGVFNITTEPAENGTIKIEAGESLSESSAYAGDKVVVKVIPDEDCRVTSVMYNDGEDHVINAVDGEYYFTMPGADVRVFATFENTAYTVKFDANGGEGVMDDQKMYKGEEDAITANVFTKEDCTFKGWATEVDGSVVYRDKELVTDIANPGEEITLYAVWDAEYKEYALTSNELSAVEEVMSDFAEVSINDNRFIVIKLTSDLKGRISLDNNGGTYILDLNGKTIYPGKMDEAISLEDDFYGTLIITGSGEIKKGKEEIIYVGRGTLCFSVEDEMDFFKLKDGTNNVFDVRNTEIKFYDYTNYEVQSDALVMKQGIFGNYTISFVANGGSGVMEEQIIEAGVETAISENTFTRKYYTFKGWATRAGGEVVYVDKEEVIDLKGINESLTLYAVWEAVYTDYVITSDELEHVKDIISDVADVTKDDESGVVTIKLETEVWGRICFDRNEGNFVIDLNGYDIVPGNKNEAVCLDNIFTGTVTLTGEGTLEKGIYNIIYQGSLGKLYFDVAEDKEYFTLTDGEEVFFERSRIKQEFEADSLLEERDELTLIQGLFERYTVTFDANGGTVEVATGTTDSYGKLTSLPTPKLSKYSFRGWYTEVSGGTKITTNTVFDADTTVYARWRSSSGGSSGSGGGGGTIVVCSILFETNGGSIVTKQSVDKNDKIKEPKAPTKEGYVFAGWYADKELKNLYDFDAKVTKDVTLYAKWTPAPEKHEDKCPSKAFKDLDVTQWYHADIDYVLENEIFKGATETEFAPNKNLTRAMLVTLLYRMEGEPATNRSIPFADVDMGAYYANAVSWAKQNDIVKGISETEFAPDVNITREQMAAIMYRYAEFKGMDVSVGENTNILSYEDFDEISEYAIPAMQYACGSELIKGRTEKTLNPEDMATRAETAAMLHRFIENNK